MVLKNGCSFFAYNWKLPAYTGAFLLAIDNFSLFTYSWSFLTYNFSLFTYNWSSFAHSGKVRLRSSLRDCKQISLTVSKKTPTVSKKTSTLVARAIRNAIRANRFARIIRNWNPIFIARQADSRESLEFPIRANRVIRANRANRFARITPLRKSSTLKNWPMEISTKKIFEGLPQKKQGL